MHRVALLYRAMKSAPFLACLCFLAGPVSAQIQVDLKFPRLQYIAYEPVVATLTITNHAGRDVDLHDENGQAWFGLEVTGSEGQLIAPVANPDQAPLKIDTGKRATQKINLTPMYAVHDFGTYRVRAHVYFADLNKYFYSQTKVFEVADARPVWQKTVGIPERAVGPGDARTYSLLTNRFPDHTSLYVRVEDKDSGIVYATYSLGHVLAFDEPQAELDQANQLHVLYCAAPRNWSYARVSLNGELLSHASFLETKTRPHLVRALDGGVKVAGGMIESPVQQAARDAAPKLSTRPPNIPKGD
jgi:hypothetical protein